MGRYNRKWQKNGNAKRKWRQQKLAVGTVQKIARRVAKMQIEKQEEPKFAVNLVGGLAANTTSLPTRCIITKSGLYHILPGPAANLLNISNEPLQNHPMTYPFETDLTGQTGVNLKVNTGKGYREGDTIVLKGIGLKGYMCLGKDIANARVYAGFHKAEQTIVNPQGYLPELDGMVVRREIDSTEKLNGTKESKTWTLNHRANDQEIKIPVNLYLKVQKRIRYNKNQPDKDAGVMDQIWYEDLRYYLVMYSDCPDDVLTGGIPNNIPNANMQQILDRFPTFYGRFTAYYRDS